MKKSNPTHVTDEVIAFVVFLACCVISFFGHPALGDVSVTWTN